MPDRHVLTRRLLLALALSGIVAYGALLRGAVLSDMYGPFAAPGWLAASDASLRPVRDALVPAGWSWKKVDKPYVGGDPANYLKFAREMTAFYQPHVREPLFLAATRGWLWLTSGADVSVSLASMTFGLLAIVAAYLLGAAVRGPGVGLLAAAGMALDCDLLAWAPEGWRDEAFTCFVTLTAWACVRWREAPGVGRAIMLGLVAAGACLTRITALSFIVPALLWLACSGGRASIVARAKGLAVAVVVAAALVGPYLINCAIATGDPLYAINYHTVFYRAAEGTPYDQPQSAAAYVRTKFATRPIATTDTAIRGLVTQPFVIKWQGFEPWRPGLGALLRLSAAAGVILWLFLPVGRLLLVLLVGSLVPYMVTWASPGGDAWRFTMHVYPIYLVAAGAAWSMLARGLRQIVAEPATLRAVAWRREALRAGGVLAVVGAGMAGRFWAPYLTVREGLLLGESSSVAVGQADEVFYTESWSAPVQTGAVTARLATAERAEIRVPLPERRAYRLVMRLDPLPFADGRPQRVRVFLDGRQVGAFELVPSVERMGSYTVELSADVVQPGRRRLEFVSEFAAPISEAGDVFPEIDRRQRVAFRLWYVRLTPL